METKTSEKIKFKRDKKVEKSFDDLFDEPFLRKPDNRTQKQKDKEWVENFKKQYMTDVEETPRKSPKK